jgi:hypothetical protein
VGQPLKAQAEGQGRRLVEREHGNQSIGRFGKLPTAEMVLYEMRDVFSELRTVD